MSLTGGSDLLALIISVSGAFAVVKTTPLLEKSNILSKAQTRKVTHIAAGLIYMATWVFYSSSNTAPFIASIAVLLPTIQILLVGLGIMKDERLLAGMTRNGRPSELMSGPLLYSAISVVWTIVWWRSSVPGIVGLAALYAGDGMAGLLGLTLGHHFGPLPHSKDKTWVGSLSCLVFTFLGSLMLLQLFISWGQLETNVSWARLLATCSASAITAAVVESHPVKEFDNLTVPMAATATAVFMMM